MRIASTDKVFQIKSVETTKDFVTVTLSPNNLLDYNGIEEAHYEILSPKLIENGK